MTNIGTVFKKNSTKAMLLGSGELGREVAIELKRLGLEVVAVDKYADAPAMQVADRSRVISMLDSHAKARGAREARIQRCAHCGCREFYDEPQGNQDARG